MNVRIIVKHLGMLLCVMSIIMVLSAAAAAIAERLRHHDVDGAAQRALLWSSLAGAAVGGLLLVIGHGARARFGRREAILLVALTWLIGGLLVALPYRLWAAFQLGLAADHPFHRNIDCYFEAVSGLTTAGSSVLTYIEQVPHGLLLWRAASQWLGGIGIVVLFVAVFPALGVGAKKLFRFETSTASRDTVMPTIRATARVLLAIYVGLTGAEALMLMLCGMEPFDAVTHAFTTLATGGFSTRNASVGAYDSAAIQIVITVFMILGGVNFALYHQVLRRRFREVYKDHELRLYLALVIGGSIVVALIIQGDRMITTTAEEVTAGVAESLRHAMFNVASVQTTTGYATADYNLWPAAATSIMTVLMLVGGCAGSTSGGMKVIRLIIAYKVLRRVIERSFRPQVVRPVRIDRHVIDEDLQLNTLSYVLAMFVVLSAGTIALMIMESGAEIDLVTAASANIAVFCTTGPGFGKVGPVANFGWLSGESKLVLCLVMVLGRLEIMALAALLMPRFWRQG